jgi:POT family proton-dependent oligopeptide transporter
MSSHSAQKNDLEGKRTSHESAEYHKLQAQLANDPNIIRQGGPIPISAWFIIVTELCERFAFYGASLIFQGYLIKVLHQPKSAATAINRGFTFFAYLTAVLGAVIADAKLGKFKTILIFSISYMIGLVLLTLSSMKWSLEANFGLAGFIVATYIFIACGTGGIKSNVSAFAADQIKDGIHPTSDPKIYHDSRITVESVFRYFYWAINVGALLGQTICPSVSHSSYPLAFLIPAITFFIGTTVFVLGRGMYYRRPASGSILLKVWRCIRYAMKNKQSNAAHWLDRAKGVQGVEWNDKFVDDVKRTLNACKVFLFFPFYWALYANMTDNFINQGLNMKRPSWLDESQLNAINPLVLVVAIPFFDMIVFPFLRARGFKLGPITRITTGFVIVTIGFVYVTILQKMVYSTGPYYDFQTKVPADGSIPVNDLSIWWQMPPYAIIAISEIFSSVTGLEFAYKQAAPELKSIVMSLFLLTNCGGSLIGMFLAIWSRDPLFVTVFAVQTTMVAVICVIFWFCFKQYDDVDA